MNSATISREQVTDMAIAILQATDDGERLAPGDLHLVELAVNDRLNPEGMARFEELHANASKRAGYTTPYLFGIEHLAIGHDRTILWKGVPVEQFDHAVWKRPGWQERMRVDARKVAACCRALEAEGTVPSMLTLTGW
jgi:hypothetical protein